MVIEVFESMIHDAERQFTITILWVICMHTVKRNITSLSQDCMYYSDSSTMYLWNIFKLAEDQIFGFDTTVFVCTENLLPCNKKAIC